MRDEVQLRRNQRQECVIISKTITSAARRFSGTLAVAARHLKTGETIELNATEVCPTASMIKMCILAEVFRQRDAGRLSLEDKVTVRKSDKVGGSGLLDCLSDDLPLPVYDLCVLMMSISDNTATNVLIDLCGLENVNDCIQAAGMTDTVLRRKISFKGKRGISNPPFAEGTPRDFVNFLGNVHRGKLLSRDSARKMLGIMRIQKYMGHLNRHLLFNPYAKELRAATGVRWVASKTGGVKGVRTESGLIATAKGVYAVSVMTKDCKDERWSPDNEGNVTVAEVSRLVYDYMVRG